MSDAVRGGLACRGRHGKNSADMSKGRNGAELACRKRGGWAREGMSVLIRVDRV